MDELGHLVGAHRGTADIVKILMFTPTSTSSAIAGVSERLVHELARVGHRVSVVRCESEDNLALPSRAFGETIITWTDEASVSKAHAECDGVVFQVGDHYGFHAGVVHWLDSLSGLVCLHDAFLGDLFLSWQHATGRDHGLVSALYGEQTAIRFQQAAAVGVDAFIEFASEHAPMTEWIGGMASGVIAHSEWGAERARASSPGRVVVTPLPYPKALPPRRTPTLRGPGDALVVVTIGHANANKRIEQVIRAIGSDPLLARHVRYRHVGFAEPTMRAQLTGVADRSGVDFVMSGQVDDGELGRALAGAHAASCLRYPALEGASASLLDALVAGLPTLVTDVGSYAELPDDVVVKIPVSDEIPAIAAALRRWVDNPEQARGIGLAGQGWAYDNADVARYADVLVESLEESLRAAPVLRAMRRAVGLLGQWEADQTVIHHEQFWEPLRIFSAVLEPGGPRADQQGHA